MAMFALNYAILMVSMWACESVDYAQVIKILGEWPKFTPSITLHTFDRVVKLKFNHFLELHKLRESIRLKSKRENPHKSREGINTS